MTIRPPLRRLPLLSIVALVVLGLGIMPAVVHATTITVTTTADENGSGSACSLREAIHAANQDTAFGGCAAGSGADTISVPPGTYTLTEEGAYEEDTPAPGEIEITNSLTIIGASRSTTVIANSTDAHLFVVHGAGITATIARVTLQGTDNSGTNDGIRIRPEATLVLTGSSISGNGNVITNEGTLQLTDSEATGSSRYSASIHNTGRASLLRSTVTGGGHSDGGGIANDGEMTVVDSSLSGTTSGSGGAVANRGVLTLQNSTVHDGSVAGAGGGILNSGTAIVINSTISHNGGSHGGGIYNTGTMTMTNSTISHNDARSQGGGIWNSGTFRINNSTISANSAPGDYEDEDNGGGGIVNSGGTVTLANTILTGNSADVPGTADCVGTLTSAGYNLFGVTTGCTITGDTTGNLVGIDPRLGPLQNNGGPTWTHALLGGSPALDAGHPGPSTSCEATDQRGEARLADGDGNGSPRCDIGAYEHESVAIVTATATPTQTANPTLTSTPTATGTATSLPTATGTATSLPTTTGTVPSLPTATPTRTPSAQPTTGPALQSVYLPLVVNVRRAGP